MSETGDNKVEIQFDTAVMANDSTETGFDEAEMRNDDTEMRNDGKETGFDGAEMGDDGIEMKNDGREMEIDCIDTLFSSVCFCNMGRRAAIWNWYSTAGCYSKEGGKSPIKIQRPMGCGMGSLYPARRRDKEQPSFKKQDTSEQPAPRSRADSPDHS